MYNFTVINHYLYFTVLRFVMVIISP